MPVCRPQRSITLDGASLHPRDVLDVAAGASPVLLDAAALQRAQASHRAAKKISEERPVYGRSTGVGANRDEPAADDREHGLRLLRSHAAGIGPLLPDEHVRAMLTVRANQILAGGAGLHSAFAEALAACLNSTYLPDIHELGAVGTGDLTALAEAALTLIGERPWARGSDAPPPRIELGTGDALAFLSSNALTIGQAALGWAEIHDLLRATHVVTALSFLAVDGNAEAYADQVHAARPHPAQVAVASEIRRLLGTLTHTAARIQDPFGYRCFPQVHGPAVEAAAALERVLIVDINSAAENPLIDPTQPAAYHHGGFHQAALGLALDSMRLALLHTAHLSTARLAALMEPAFTGLRPFLADGACASSGVLILEYSASSALALLRSAASPTSVGHSVLSRGVEEHASFASQSARQTLQAASAFRLVLACELVATVRALRQRKVVPDPSTPAGRAFAAVVAQLDADTEDRPLGDDVHLAARLLHQFATV